MIRAYDAKSGQLKRIFTAHEGAVNTLTIVGDKLYSGASDATMRVWDCKDISEDLLVDDEPPPAPATTDTISSLERDLEKDHVIVPIPDEPGIINMDDDAPEDEPEDENDEPDENEEENDDASSNDESSAKSSDEDSDEDSD